MIMMITSTLPVICLPEDIDVGNAFSKEARSNDQQEQAWDDQHGLGEAHQRVVDPASIIGGDRADHCAQEHFHEGGRYADHQRDLPAIDGARQDIPPDRIRAPGIFRGGRLQFFAGIGTIGPGFAA